MNNKNMQITYFDDENNSVGELLVVVLISE
jgi:hypothetical protein